MEYTFNWEQKCTRRGGVYIKYAQQDTGKCALKFPVNVASLDRVESNTLKWKLIYIYSICLNTIDSVDRGVDETHSQKTRRLDGIFHFHPFRRRLCVKHDHLQLLILMCWCDDDAMHQHNFMQSPQAHQFVVCVYVMREWVLVQNSLCVWGSSSPIWISTRINMFSIIHFKMWIINSICWMTCAPMIAETHAHT